jgi:hypothetical protein
VISANQDNGILAEAGITVLGNRIGTAFDGDSMPVDSNGNVVYQGSGILAENLTDQTMAIGAPGTGYGNLISGNVIGIQIENAGGTLVQNNLIGTTDSGDNPLPNKTAGVYITDSSNVSIGYNLGNLAKPGYGNIIGYNGQDGVYIDSGSSQVSVLKNSIKDNSNLGIELQSGANNNQAAPVLTTVSYTSATSLSISGSVKGAANTTYRVEFFVNPPSNNAQGETFLGAENVTTIGNGTASFTASLSVPAGLGTTAFTATATDPNNNTSPFSNAVRATSPPSPAPSATSPPGSPPPPSFFEAAITLFIDGAELLEYERGFSAFFDLTALNASIAYYSPYAGPFASFFVLAGEVAVAGQLQVNDQAVANTPGGVDYLATPFA